MIVAVAFKPRAQMKRVFAAERRLIAWHKVQASFREVNEFRPKEPWDEFHGYHRFIAPRFDETHSRDVGNDKRFNVVQSGTEYGN